MAAGANIIAHDNTYNRFIPGEDAGYFTSHMDIKNILVQIDGTQGMERMEVSRKRNLEKIRKNYQWEKVVDNYEKLFIQLLENTERP